MSELEDRLAALAAECESRAAMDYNAVSSQRWREQANVCRAARDELARLRRESEHWKNTAEVRDTLLKAAEERVQQAEAGSVLRRAADLWAEMKAKNTYEPMALMMSLALASAEEKVRAEADARRNVLRALLVETMDLLQASGWDEVCDHDRAIHARRQSVIAAAKAVLE